MQQNPLPLFDRILRERLNIVNKKEIGRGSFGAVYKIIIGNDKNKETDEKTKLFQLDSTKAYAMKILYKSRLKYDIREALLLNSLNHPFVIKSAACCFFKESKPRTSFITPYEKHGSLTSKLKKDTFFNKWTALERNKFLYGMCRSVWFLHHLNIFHRDIKSENILITEDKMPLLSDLGISKVKKFSIENSVTALTEWRSPPDAFDNNATFPVDVFTLALSLWEFIEKKSITDFVIESQKQKYVVNPYLFYDDDERRPQFTNETPDNWKELIKMMWKTDQLQRPTMDEVIQEVSKKEYFLPGVNENEMISFIEKVNKEEHEAYYFKMNDITKFIINEDQIYFQVNNKNDGTNSIDICPSKHFIPSIFKSAINKVIDQIKKEEENIHNFDAMFSIALFCMTKLYDYSEAYKILKAMESVDENKSEGLLQLISKESEKSLFIKGMILEGQEKYQEASEIYNESIDNEGFDIRVYGRLGRLYAIYGCNSEIREEGLQMMDHSSFLGDDFSSFQLGLFYLNQHEKNPTQKSDNLEKSRHYFELVQVQKTIYEQIYDAYYIEDIEDKISEYKNIIDDILSP